MITAVFPTFFGAVRVRCDTTAIWQVDLMAPGTEYTPPPEIPLIQKFHAWLNAYETRDFQPMDLPLHLEMVPAFSRRVLVSLADICPGRTLTYAELGRRLGLFHHARAIGQVMARNPWPLLLPCHRVVAAQGQGGFGPGPAMKRALLEHESGNRFFRELTIPGTSE